MGAAVTVAGLALLGAAGIGSAGAAPKAGVPATDLAQATDIGARPHARHDRHDRYAYRGHDQPYYYGRPEYYRPYPYAVPAPFFLGFGFGPWW